MRFEKLRENYRDKKENLGGHMSLKDKVEHLSKVKASLQELKQDIEDKDHAQEQKIKARENRLQRVYKKLKGGKIANNERACKCKAHERKTLA